MLAIKSSGADMLGTYFTFDNDLAIFARQLRQLGVTHPLGRLALDHRSPGAVKLAGPALFGTYGVADYAEDSSPTPRISATPIARSPSIAAGQLQFVDL